MAVALGAIAEGVLYYDLANAVAADVRVKDAFEDLGRRKRAQLSRLEPLLPPGAKDAAPKPGIFPVDSVSRAECYVCGHLVAAADLPGQCPNCGAARYAFEKEIALAKAWRTAAESARKSSKLFRDAAAKAAAPVKAVLEELTREEERLVAEADRELADLRA